MTETKDSGNSNNRSRRRRPSGQRNAQDNNRSQGQKPQSNSRKKNNNNRNRNRNRNRNKNNNSRGPTLVGVELTLHKYQNLLEQHLISRRKYFELFDRADPNQKAKLERNYFSNCQKMRDFENNLTPEEKAEFNIRNHETSPDNIYSSNNNLDPAAIPIPFEGDFEDPHLLVSQSSSNFSEDSEESTGTMEDYQAYREKVSS